MQKVSPNNLILFKKNDLFLTLLVYISVHFFSQYLISKEFMRNLSPCHCEDSKICLKLNKYTSKES